MSGERREKFMRQVVLGALIGFAAAVLLISALGTPTLWSPDAGASAPGPDAGAAISPVLRPAPSLVAPIGRVLPPAGDRALLVPGQTANLPSDAGL
ncbi:MAG: hypothetical protein HYZ28_13000 [Myxococcales bacterium]|nr:hypothetical protein [Myxococcales bacterium]